MLYQNVTPPPPPTTAPTTANPPAANVSYIARGDVSANHARIAARTAKPGAPESLPPELSDDRPSIKRNPSRVALVRKLKLAKARQQQANTTPTLVANAYLEEPAADSSIVDTTNLASATVPTPLPGGTSYSANTEVSFPEVGKNTPDQVISTFKTQTPPPPPGFKVANNTQELQWQNAIATQPSVTEELQQQNANSTRASVKPLPPPPPPAKKVSVSSDGLAKLQTTSKKQKVESQGAQNSTVKVGYQIVNAPGVAKKSDEDLSVYLTKQPPLRQVRSKLENSQFSRYTRARTERSSLNNTQKQNNLTVASASETIAPQNLQQASAIASAKKTNEDLSAYLTKQPPNRSATLIRSNENKVTNNRVSREITVKTPQVVADTSNTLKLGDNNQKANLTAEYQKNLVRKLVESKATQSEVKKSASLQVADIRAQEQDNRPSLTQQLPKFQPVTPSQGEEVATLPSALKNTENLAAPSENTQIAQELANSNANGRLIEFNTSATANSQTESLLLGVIINDREVGSLEVIRQGNTLLIPLAEFADITNMTLESANGNAQLKTPLGIVKLSSSELTEIRGIAYISDRVIQSKLAINLKLNSSDLALDVSLPWRRETGKASHKPLELQPEFFAPSAGLSNFRQEFDINTTGSDTTLRTSTVLGGRIAGGAVTLRVNNNFVDSPNVSEYYFYKRFGQTHLQLGRQQIGLHPLLTGMSLTGIQLGSSNLPSEQFARSSGANELLPRRSRPIQSFRGEAPPTSFVQLRVSGAIVAEQVVGFNGEYEFVDVNLPSGQSNEIEVLIYDPNNPTVPKEIRTVRLNASDLLLPAGGFIQLAGVGFSGNLAQDVLFDNDRDANGSGYPVGFYQLRAGLSNNLTFEGTIQALSDRFQTQAGFVWRPASPLVIATSVGSSRGEVGYTTDLDLQLDSLQIVGNSQFFPQGFSTSRQSRDRYNHSLELKYKANPNFNLGFIARSRQDDGSSSDYILPVFSLRPNSSLYFSGRPDFQGNYLLNAAYQLNRASRLSLNSFGDIYTTDFSYNLSREYLLSLGTEFGGDLANRYSLTLNRNANSLSDLSWRLGMAYRDGDVGAIVGASMRLLPGLHARVEYQGVPSKNRNLFGSDDSLSISLVSDLSFAGGRVTPSEYGGIGKEIGGIAGKIVLQGNKKDFDLSGASVRVLNNRSQFVGTAKTDSDGNFFVGNLLEGMYLVELEPNDLPIEVAIPKTSAVAEVASAAVTRLDFNAREEYGFAGRITDASGTPMVQVKIELFSSAGKRVMSGSTDQFGLYRFDGVPGGNYILQVPPQEGIEQRGNVAKLQVEINNGFAYEQNIQLPVSVAAKNKHSSNK